MEREYLHTLFDMSQGIKGLESLIYRILEGLRNDSDVKVTLKEKQILCFTYGRYPLCQRFEDAYNYYHCGDYYKYQNINCLLRAIAGARTRKEMRKHKSVLTEMLMELPEAQIYYFENKINDALFVGQFRNVNSGYLARKRGKVILIGRYKHESN